MSETKTPQKGSHAQGDDKLQRQASQLAYDVKYKVKQKLGKESKMSPAQVTKAYMSQLASSPAPSAVKALAKKKLVGEEYTSFMRDAAKDLVLESLSKVFIEGVEEKVEEVVSEGDEKKYKVRVTDKASGNTYVTQASRAKISELRANKNISSVEMTSYGTAIQEKGKGKKAKKDYDGDGKVESGSKEHAGAVHNAIQRKKGGKPDGQDTRTEEVIFEDDSEEKKVTGKGVNNKAKIKIMPNLGEAAEGEVDQKKVANLTRLQLKKQQLERQKLQMQKQGKVPLNTEEAAVEKKEEDERAKPTEMKLLKNKMRARGVKIAGEDPTPRNMKTYDDLDKGDVAEGLKQARANVGASKCWPGKKAKGTKMKNGREVPNCVPEEKELEERTRYAKETGKDFKTGKPSEKGGTRTGKTPFDKVSREMRKTGGVMSSRGKGIQPQGKKKEKGKKGYKGVTPVDKIKNRLAQKRAPKPSMGSRFD